MIWCLGTYASGSTWVFNAVIKVAASVPRAQPFSARFVTCHEDVRFFDDRTGLAVVKLHDTDDQAAAVLERHADAVLLSIRDPRDCVTSLMLYQNHSFAAALAAVERTARYAARFASHPKVKILRYEAGFIDDISPLDLIAASLGGALAEADRVRIFAETRRPAIEDFIATFGTLPTAVHHAASGDIVDTASQWHRHHAHRSGEVGRWRHMPSAQQVAAVEQCMQDWMAVFGYPAILARYTLSIGSLAVLAR